jgi:hypothetical protein
MGRPWPGVEIVAGSRNAVYPRYTGPPFSEDQAQQRRPVIAHWDEWDYPRDESVSLHFTPLP